MVLNYNGTDTRYKIHCASTEAILTWSTLVLLCSIRAQWQLKGRQLHISAGVSLKHTADGSYIRPL